MAHELDITKGHASFVTANVSAWHALGTTLDHAFTAEEAMREGHLGGWNVRKSPTFTYGPEGEVMPLKGRFAVLRDNPITSGQVDVIGNVGEVYHIIQNEAHADLLNTLVDESGAHFETAGAINGGSRVFITMKLPGHIKIGKVDKVENYLAAVNSHDGSASFMLMVTPVRIVCQNTLNMAFNGANNMFRVRHTSGSRKIIVQQARETLDMAFGFIGGFQEQAEKLIQTSMTQMQFEAIVEQEFAPPDDAPPATVTRAETKIAQLSYLFADALTQKGIANTAWAGLNAMTEWNDHYAPTRGATPDISRAQKAVLDPDFKNRALGLITSFANKKVRV